MPHVVTEPEHIRGVYESWAECQAVVGGVTGAKYQRVKDRQEAEAMIDGTGVVLGPGLYAFTDGNHRGGVGVVIVRVGQDVEDDPMVLREISASVKSFSRGAGMTGLESDQEVEDALRQLRNILAELGGLICSDRWPA